MADDPIIIKPGSYPQQKKPLLKGVCVVIDDRNLWDIKKNDDGTTTIIIPANSKWVVMHDSSTTKKKVAILRLNGELLKEQEPIPYTHPDD